MKFGFAALMLASAMLSHTAFAFNPSNFESTDNSTDDPIDNPIDVTPEDPSTESSDITGTLTSGRYVITNAASGKALSVEGGSNADGVNVEQQPYSENQYQQWNVSSLGNGDYSIRVVNGNKSLDVWEWNEGNGADARIWPYLNAENQHWIITDTGNGHYSIVSRFSDKALEVADGKSENGANVAFWDFQSDASQLWTFKSIEFDSNAGSQPVNVYIAGDSTVSTYEDTYRSDDQAGWGQMIPEQYNTNVTFYNRAIGGRSARRFIDEGRLSKIWSEIKPGDYFFVQFGTNDGHKTATYNLNGRSIPYYLDPNTDFKYYLKQYADGARARNVNLVFVTPPPRNSAYCTGGNGTGAHAQAMRELAAAEGVPVADLNRKTVDYLIGLCPAPQPEGIYMLRPDGSVDGTHFQENGARILSRFVADGVSEAGLSLDQYRK